MPFPTPFAGQSVLYPVTAAKRYPVAVLKFTDMTEQRYRQSAGVSRFTLQLDQISKAEKDAIFAFFDSSKGSFDSLWDITIGADNYDYMAFANDTLEATERENGAWSMSIPLVQTRKN